MKKALKDIKPGFGLGNLKFGMTRAEVKLMLGEPSFIDKYSHSESEDDLTESWEYDELELSISFDEEEDVPAHGQDQNPLGQRLRRVPATAAELEGRGGCRLQNSDATYQVLPRS